MIIRTLSTKGMILIFAITQSNVDDQERHKNEGFLKAVFGKLLADKGYISQKLTDILFVNDIHLLTSIRNNIKKQLNDNERQDYAPKEIGHRNGQG